MCVCMWQVVQLQSCSGICVSGLLFCMLDGCWRGAHAPYRYIAADKLALAKAAKQPQNTFSGMGRLASQVHVGNSG